MKVTDCLYCGFKDLTKVTQRSDNNGILECGRCGVMMVENISDDTESLYTADYFEKSKGTKSGYTNYLSSPVANLMGKYGFTRLFAREPGRHLDLGCADGSLIEIFNGEGYDSGGLEISKDAVAIANAKGLDVSFSTLHSFPKGIKQSNVITAFDLLEHADRPGLVLKEVYKNLNPDGYFVFSTLSVQKDNPGDYWFNNSLEHYIYYNKENLTYVLTEIFGKDRFAFVEIEINGVAEFWGFAKKGKLDGEASIITNIASGGFDKKDVFGGYLVSLFYDQLSMFAQSEAIIDYFANKWTPGLLLQARFYNYYFQGKFEKALKELDDRQYLVGTKNSAYWQAVSFVRQQFAAIREEDIATGYNEEIVNLRGELFKTRDELQGIKNSRVLGRIVSARDRVGGVINSAGGVKKVPLHVTKRAVHKTRITVAPMFPEETRNTLKAAYRKAKSHASSVQRKSPDVDVVVTTIHNKKASTNKPLLSVVIPYYNRGDTIDETIASLQQQTFKDFEVIIVNDGSKDAQSIEKLAQLDLTGLTAEVVNQKNQGVAVARNNGIAKTKGEYVICLDSDDILEPTFIEKALLVLETQPDVSLVTTNVQIFGVMNEIHINKTYNAEKLLSDNMVITAAAFRKEAWVASGGYKSGIGYEDWEFWINLAEHGYWAKNIEENLFVYRTSLQSRYVEDKDIHWNNLKVIRSLHPNYKKTVRQLQDDRKGQKTIVTTDTALINLDRTEQYLAPHNQKPNVMITMSWMTFGGAETLVYNYCREIKDDVNITFVTGLKSENEWEYKFRSISPSIYHLPNLFDDPKLYIEFVSNYIQTRGIDILHIVHNGFIFDMLPELKKRHPKLQIIVTLFNDRVPAYVEGSIKYQPEISQYTTDNEKVKKSLESKLEPQAKTTVIPNGIDVYDEFSPALFSRASERSELNISDNDLAIFFVGRLSEEKNPDVFVTAANLAGAKKDSKNLKFFIIGDGPMRSDIEKQIRETHGANITYLGYQAAPAKFLSAGDIFVLPSAIEGFPLSVLEAMAMNLAVIASDVGAVSEVIHTGKDGFVITPGSAQEISDIVVTLAGERSQLDAVKTAARKSVEKKYSNRILGANYRKLYRK